mgnify:CR=1 FL=1|tara:strand:+ start:1261 stop:1971 length:711 start_codon:yes stop_codon:yes gene_type:complete
MEVLILAGGRGERLKSIVSDRPKPLADVNGRPFLEYLMDYLINYGASHFILLTGYQSQKIRDHFGQSYKSIKISYSEETTPLGTGGAVTEGLKFLQNHKPFLVVNGDTYFNVDILRLEKLYNRSNSDISIALFRADEENRYGSVELTTNSRINYVGSSKAQINQPAIGGIFLVSNSILEYFHSNARSFSMEKIFLPTIIRNGGIITGMLFDESFADIGTPADYNQFCKDNKQRYSY